MEKLIEKVFLPPPNVPLTPILEDKTPIQFRHPLSTLSANKRRDTLSIEIATPRWDPSLFDNRRIVHSGR
ncbi:hypothetical protein NPIL_209791 [Nephila pilipes]|uniref:Uncharacterized protein n=1 Tax=Nephila pilipes TaxID=299642 RepID=A0A8X6PA35_NEPPI|nr:hypothetical protein NPIL_209791 [Nephila pilipes]